MIHVCPVHSHTLSLGSVPPCGSSSYRGLQHTKSSKGLSFNIKQKLWTPAFVLASQKTRLDFFCGRMDGDGRLETQGQLSCINLTTAQFLVCGSLEFFPHNMEEGPDFYQQQEMPARGGPATGPSMKTGHMCLSLLWLLSLYLPLRTLCWIHFFFLPPVFSLQTSQFVAGLISPV